MKTFTREQIEATRSYMKSQGFQLVSAEVDGLKFSYYVVSQERNPALPDFVMRLTCKTPAIGELFGVSDSVPEAHRPYAVAHEVIEFRELGIDHPDRCIQALERELASVPQDIRTDYIARRGEFFRKLAVYAKERAEEHPDEYTEDDIRQFEANARRLEELAA